MSASKMGKNGNFAKFVLREENGQVFEAVYFGDWTRFAETVESKYGAGAAEKLFLQKCDYRISVTYQLGINLFRGREEIQLVLQNFC